MDRLPHFLAPRWFAVYLLGIALLLALGWLTRRKLRSWPLALVGGVFALAGLGGLILPVEYGMGIALVALAGLFGMFLWLIVTNQWSAPAAWIVAGAMVFGVGGWMSQAATDGLTDLGRTAAKVEVVHPWWLLLLGLAPLIIALSFRSLAGLGSFRRWLAIGLRCLVIALLTLALAEVRLRQQNDSITVLFLVDRSLSVPPEYDPTGRIDLRWERVKTFLNDAMEKRGDAHKRDKAGVILFGRRPRLELPASDAPSFTKDRSRFLDDASIDPNYTDIAAAIKLALASFPEGSGKRIVLISDGNENLGNAEEQARLAKQNGVPIDVVPLAAGYRNEDDVLVQSVEAPPLTEQGARFPIRVLIRSYNRYPVKGLVTLRQIANGQAKIMPPAPGKPGGPMEVTLRPGLNSVSFPPPEDRPKGSYTYEAIFQPTGVLVNGELRPAPRGHPQNKRATTHVLALGQRKILLVEGKEGEQEHLFDTLRGLKDSKFKVYRRAAALLPKDKADLALLLADYDCLILANTPSEMLDEDQQEIVRSNTYDQGCGLIMIGGPEGFGAGGWQGTPVEKALPVDCDIKSMKVQGKGGLVLIMHGTEMAQGNFWEKKIGELALKKLSPVDMIGVVYWDWQNGGANNTKWHIPFQTLGGKRDALIRLVNKMEPGDMMDCNPALQQSFDKLTNPTYQLAKKHIIFISDGDHWTADPKILARMRVKKVTCTTVCITTHGPGEVQRMNAIATATGGKFYNVTNPRALPEIYTKEVRLVSQSFVYPKEFKPKLVFSGGPADKLPQDLPTLKAFVRTTPKPSPLVEKPILGPPQGDQDFPVLAYWQYGLGKSAAFTSDARSRPDHPEWDVNWAESDMYQKFWEQVVDWSLRAVETGRLTMTTEYRDGKVKVTVDARDKRNRPLTDLKLRGSVTPPSPRADSRNRWRLKFEQKSSGIYQAEFKADDSGSYFINAASLRDNKGKDQVIDSVRSGVTIPYSPEFADMESNTALLEKLRDITGGITIADNSEALSKAARSGEVFRAGSPFSRSMRPIWFWLVFVSGLLLVFDIAARRIALEPEAVAAATGRLWNRLRGRAAWVQTPPLLERLQTRREPMGESLDRPATRFQGGDAPTADVPPADETRPNQPPAPPTTAPGVAPEKPQEPEDFASRLMKAKKKVWEERDKGKNG